MIHFIQLLPLSFGSNQNCPFCVLKFRTGAQSGNLLETSCHCPDWTQCVVLSPSDLDDKKSHQPQDPQLKAQTNPRKMQELSQELLGKPSVKLVGFYQPFEVMRIIGKKVFYSFRLVMINDETPNYSKIVEQLHHVPFWKLTYPLPTA